MLLHVLHGMIPITCNNKKHDNTTVSQVTELFINEQIISVTFDRYLYTSLQRSGFTCSVMLVIMNSAGTSENTYMQQLTIR